MNKWKNDEMGEWTNRGIYKQRNEQMAEQING